MKICAIICEYNPFHNGHLLHINEAKRRSNADAIVCFMSGNFVQRGDAAIMDKHTRARHAVLAGADAVIELPTLFATSNAELFAKGAVKLLSSIPTVTTLCFGAETANKTAFKLGAKYLLNEPEEVSNRIKTALQTGTSYAKARADAFVGFLPTELLTSPNNVLGLEYTKALLLENSTIDILPIERMGAGYGDEILRQDLSSATAIRTAIEKGEPLGDNLPEFVKKDLPLSLQNSLEQLEKYALINRNTEEIASVCDCTEGLENAFKRVATENLPIVETLTSARYTSSRIRRIALQNLLNIKESLIRESLQSSLYLCVLAVKKTRNDVLSALSESIYPLIARPRDIQKLSGIANQCFEKDKFAEQIYNLLYPSNKKEIDVFI